jgi:two-component system, oxyanion-binding sensor
MPTSFLTPALARVRPLRVGFLPLTDAAPFAVAEECGFFARHGIKVQLTREVGWATIREKIIYGELDAAQCPAPMLWSTTLGLESVPCRVVTGLVLSVHGNAITLSERLRSAGVHDAATLREEARRRSGERKLTLGVVFWQSSHHVLLRHWLKSGGIDPDRDVRIVVVPPAQMFRNLAAGTIDGYCAGEPWNTLAVRERIGWCPLWSAAAPVSPVEKVLMVTDSFAQSRTVEHEALIHALYDACAWCDDRSNHEELGRILSGAKYINQSIHIITPSLSGNFETGLGRTESVANFHGFHRQNANAPTIAKAEAVQAELVQAGLLTTDQATLDLPARLFREDIFNSAIGKNFTHELVSH